MTTRFFCDRYQYSTEELIAFTLKNNVRVFIRGYGEVYQGKLIIYKEGTGYANYNRRVQ